MRAVQKWLGPSAWHGTVSLRSAVPRVSIAGELRKSRSHTRARGAARSGGSP